MATASILFWAERRPTVDSVRALSEAGGEFSISFEPERESDPVQRAGFGAPAWLELLVNGLTFDLRGLAPGPPEEEPAAARNMTLGGAIPDKREAVSLAPGPHLAGGGGMVPIVRVLAALAGALSQLDGAVAVAWHPARSWSKPELFRESVAGWIDGGVFPGLVLSSLAMSADQGMHSEGLALFTGQELRLEPEIVDDHEAAAKLAVRLTDYLVERGRIDHVEEFRGPDGKRLRLYPSSNGRFVRVSRA